MSILDQQQTEVPLENLDQARRVYRRFLLTLVLTVGAGCFIAFYSEAFVRQHGYRYGFYVAGLSSSEWLLMFTLVVVVIMIWYTAYKIGVLLNKRYLFPISIGLTFIPGMIMFVPILAQIDLMNAVRQAGYRMGPLLGRFRPLNK